jgi:hypothetical protein
MMRAGAWSIIVRRYFTGILLGFWLELTPGLRKRKKGEKKTRMKGTLEHEEFWDDDEGVYEDGGNGNGDQDDDNDDAGEEEWDGDARCRHKKRSSFSPFAVVARSCFPQPAGNDVQHA